MTCTVQTRLKALEEAARQAEAEPGRLTVSIHNNKVHITTMPASKFDVETETASPMDAVSFAEKLILSKAPGRIYLRYAIDNLFDMYPNDVGELFGEYAPVTAANFGAGDYYSPIKQFSLRHVILFNHVNILGRATLANEWKGITYTDADFEQLLQSESALLVALLDILRKEHEWEEAHE